MKVFIWFLFFLPIVYAAENYYDYFQFVQQWPPVVCGDTKNCNLPDPMNFTIHGLWPSDSGKPGEPLNCGNDFDPSKIKPLIDDLNIYWPNLTGDCNECFWKNEWDSHGNCSADRFNEFGYFSLALELKKHLDIFRILYEGHIIPSPKALYYKTQISDVIKNTTGHIPRLWCKDDEHPSPLLEISVCYDFALAYRDCPQLLLDYPINKCDDIVRYPTSPCNITDNGTDKRDEL